MTQRILKTMIGGCAAEVLMGWDRPLQYHFMVIDVEDADEPLYSNLLDVDAGMQASLDYFIGKARSFGVEIPTEMIAALQADAEVNMGNATSYFDEAGMETDPDEL